MATRYYDEATGKWVVCGTDKALEVNIVDVADNYESTNVEGALREIATTLNEKESEITTIKEQLDDLDSDFRYHLANHPGGSGGGGGGTGGGAMPTLTSTFEDGQIIEEGQSVNIPIFFSSPNLGEGIAYIVVNGVEVGNQAISQGNNMIKVSAFSSMKNTVSIYAKDRAGMMSNQLSWTIICGGLSATVKFDSEADYSIEDKIIMQYTVATESTEDIVLHMTIDSAINDYVVEVGYNEFDFTGLSVGVHRVSFYLTSGVYKTKTFSFNIVVVDGANLYVSSTFDTSSDITYGVPVNIPYRISKHSTELFDVVFSIDGVVNKTVSVNAGSYYWTINDLTLGEHTLKIEASSLSGEYSFIELVVSVVEGEYVPVEPVTQGLLAWFDATTKSNQDTDKHIWNDKSGNGVMAYLHNFNYFSNGWIDGSLKCDGDSYVEIDMTPYADNVRLGSTIDILYKATNIGIEEARIIDYTQRENPYKGIYANILESKLTSLTNTGSVSLNEDVETRLTFVIDRANKFAKIYVNAVLSRAFYLSDSGSGTSATYEDFAHTEKIYLNSRKGEDLFGKCEIKQLRVYGRALSDDDIVQNHIADIKDLTKQKEKYDFNYNNHSTPELRFYGDMTNMTNEVFKTMRVKYTSPNEELYGQSFDQQYCQVRWQGTSSIQYVLKNFQIYLKDENMTDWYYTPFKDGAKEHILTFKCDYMESSHANNVGIAKFVNDCIYDTKTPPQQANSKLRTTVTGFPVLLYINDEFYCAGNLNLDRFSVNSLGLNSDFPNALSYEVSANTDTTAGAFFPWSSDSGKTELEYLKSDFECRYPENRVQGDDTFAEIKRLIDWVGYATDDMFKEQISQYLNLEYCIRYYLTVLMFGMVDNLGKNMMLNTWDGRIWYPTFYDCDTSTSLDNTGFMKFDCDIEMEANVFNTSNSNLWTKLRRVFETDIKSHYALMRQSNFTEENIMRYLYDEQISQIPEILYNRDAQTKYLNFGAQYLYACHGSREQQIKRWIHERLLFMDSLMDYTVSGSDFITVRANKLGYVYFDIQVFSPQYFSIKFRDEDNNTGLITKKVKRGETVRFEYNLPNATDQEIVLYYGRNIKDLGDISNLQPTTLILGNAIRLTQVICSSQYLINASISNCKMLQRIDLHDSVLLGTGEGAQQTLDVSECTNLKYINIYGTQLTALYTNTNGGNIEEIYYPYSIQTVIVKNQPRLKSIGIPIYYTGQITNENNIYADRLVNVDIANCDELVSLVINYYEEDITVPTFIGVSRARSFSISNSLLNSERIDLSHSSNMESLTLDSLYQLKEINFDDISVYNAESSNLSNVVITNCPNVETITFNQNTIDGENSLGVAFASGMTLNLSNLLNLKEVRSNVGIKGLTKLILPKTVTALVFDYPNSTQYSQTDSDILDIWSVDCNHTDDGFTGIDLLNMDVINDFSMGSLSKIENAINLDIKITNTFPYFNYFKTENFFEPIGTVDISDYTGSLAHLFKGVNLDKLEIICTKQLTQENASYMFSYASCSDKEKINTLFGFMQSITNISYMFYNAHITVAPRFPKTITDCRYTFANCRDLLETPSNWNIVYNVTPTSDYCYLDCNAIKLIDGEAGTIDDIPVTWGGYGRTDTIYKGYVVDIENTLDREIEYLMVDGVSLQNMIPMKGQTNTLSKDGETFTVEDGFIDYATIVDGAPYQICEIKGKSVRNILPTETITSQVLTNESSSFNLKDGLNENIVITEGEYVENVLHGQTKVNILESTGNEKDSMLTTNYAKTVQTNNSVDGTILKGVIEGETLQNVINGQGATEVLTTGGEQTVKTENGLSEGTAILDGEMPYAVMKGLSFVNLSKMSDFTKSSSLDTVTYTDNGVNIVFGNHATHYGRFKNKYTSLKENTWYTTYIIVTKNTLPSDCYAQFNIRHGVSGGDYRDVDGILFSSNGAHFNELHLYGGMVGTFRVATYTQNYDYTLRERYFGTLWNVIMPDGKASDYYAGSELEYGVIVIEGDTLDLGNPKYFSGIGSVKAPTLETTTYNLLSHIQDREYTFEHTDLWSGTWHTSLKDGVYRAWHTEGTLTNRNATLGIFKEGWNSLATCPTNIKEDIPVMKANVLYTISFDFQVTNYTDSNKDRLRLLFADSDLASVNHSQASSSNISIYGASDITSETDTSFSGHHRVTIMFPKDINTIFLYTQYGGQYYFDLTITNIMIVEGEVEKEYVPYKSTTITLPGDLVLHSTDTLESKNARDELDLLTGTITRNVGIFHSSESRGVQGENEKGETTYFFKINIATTHPMTTNNTKIICDGFPVFYGSQYYFEHNKNNEYDYEGICFSTYYINVRVLRSTIDAYSEERHSDRIMHWLKDINFTMYYELATPYTEQIDLSDQPKPYAYKDGYVNVSSNELTPTLDYQCISANLLNGSVSPSTTYTIFGDNAEGQILNICGEDFTISSLPMVITSGATDTTSIKISNGAVDNLMIIEGDYSSRDLEYFTGLKSVVNPLIKTLNSDSSKSTTTNLGVTLRGLNNVKDELDIKTGVVTRKIGVNSDGSLYELSSYVTENITIQTQPYIYQGGTITITSDELIPNFNYQAFNRNLLCSLNVKENTEYTIVTDSRGLIKFGGNEINIQNSPQLITTGSTNKVYFNGGKFKLYEKGISHAENIVVKNYNSTNEQLITLDKTVILYATPNKRDTYNLMTGTWTQNVGTRSYATGDELNKNVYTDMITTVYDLDSPVVTEFDSYLTPITKPITYGSVLISGNGKFESPISKFKVRFDNVYETDLLENNAVYTIINGNGLKMVLGGKDINVTSNKYVATSGTTNNQIIVVGEMNNTMLIVGDVTGIIINGYFKDYCDVVSPSITNSNSEYSTVTTTPDTLILRSVGDVYDTFDFVTGIVTRRVSETHTVLSVPFDETVEVTNPPLAYTSGTATISSSSETTVIAKGIVYRVESKTYFPFEQIETNTDYTLYIESERVGTYVLGGMVAGQTASGIVINSGSRYVAKDLRFTEDIGINKIMLLKGDTRDNIIDEYFEGISWVESPAFVISDGSTEQISTTVANLSLRRLGYTKDTYNVLTGELTRRVGVREYQQGDERNSAVQTDFKQTLYLLNSPIVSTVSISWDGALMSYYKRTKVESVNSNIHPYLNIKLPVTSLDVIQLKDNEIATLQEESLMTMMALAEIYEMTTVASETSEASTFSLRRRIVITPMASVYYKLYKKGFKDYEEIPEALREQVDYLIETEG